MDIDSAWRNYLSVCEEMRQRFLADEILYRYPSLRANAHFLLQQTQALAYALVMAPRQDSPCFYKNTYLEPLLFSGHQPCPDFVYQLAFLNGERSWRITGKRNSAHWVDIQSATGWWGEKDYAGLDNYDLNDFEMDADGNFEIIASADAQQGNWIRLNANSTNNTLMVRPAMYDWDREAPPSFHIETLDGQSAEPIIHSEAEISRRLGLCAEMVRHAIGRWTTMASPRLVEMAGINQFVVRRGDARRGGANPLAHYAQCVYELGPDQALIIETSDPQAVYWGISLGTWWWETTNYTHHRSSINGHQARLDSDGKFRAVICRQDPGVANWLDPVCWDIGIVLIRWYRPRAELTPVTQLVSVEQVREQLPADTPMVSASERAADIERRRRAVMSWYGY